MYVYIHSTYIYIHTLLFLKKKNISLVSQEVSTTTPSGSEEGLIIVTDGAQWGNYLPEVQGFGSEATISGGISGISPQNWRFYQQNLGL